MGVVVKMMETIGSRITKLREKRGLSQRGLAIKANVSNSTISRIENNQSIPYGQTLENLAKALEVSTDYILFGDSKSQDGVWEIREDSFQYALYEETKDLNDKKKREILRIIKALKDDDE